MPALEKPTLENPMQLNTDGTNPYPDNIEKSIPNGANPYPSIPHPSTYRARKDPLQVQNEIRCRISYDVLVYQYDRQWLDLTARNAEKGAQYGLLRYRTV